MFQLCISGFEARCDVFEERKVHLIDGSINFIQESILRTLSGLPKCQVAVVGKRERVHTDEHTNLAILKHLDDTLE